MIWMGGVSINERKMDERNISVGIYKNYECILAYQRFQFDIILFTMKITVFSNVNREFLYCAESRSNQKLHNFIL